MTYLNTFLVLEHARPQGLWEATSRLPYLALQELHHTAAVKRGQPLA